jgi:hypothetical protein
MAEMLANIAKTHTTTRDTGTQQGNCSFDELPTSYRLYVNFVVNQARSLLEKGGTLPVCAFLQNEDTRTFAPLIATAESGPLSSELIHLTATIMEADAILMIGESWKILIDTSLSIEEIQLQYGSIEASPYVSEACSFAFETHDGIWLANADIKTRPIGGRSFGEVQFSRVDAAMWQKMRLLPNRQKASNPTRHTWLV